ncbi:MAG: cytidylate kinase-like family protein [Clostridiales bacterium]|nr:cytidylate kinase-like family protein [Clostridiales bacterium]
MPQNQFQRMMFALITVVITVHAYVFYSLYVVNGSYFLSIDGATSVIDGINRQGGVYAFGHYLPIWAIILIEFCLAYTLENVLGSPCSFKLACKVFNPAETHHMMFETAIICATVGLMCPAMSFLASIMYYPYYAGFSIVTLFANWLKLVCFNFPFAYFTQLFFIQPLVRTIFKAIFVRDKQGAAKSQQEKQDAGETASVSAANGIITVGREFCSGGAETAKKLAEKLGYKYVDKELIYQTASGLGMFPEYIEKLEERPTGYFDIPPHWIGASGWYADQAEHSMSDNMKIMNAQRKIIENYAKESGVVIVGRTADQILKGYPNVLSVFFHADEEKRIRRCQDISDCSKEQARKAIHQVDRLRAEYYNSTTGGKWGAKNNYDMYLDLGELGTDQAVEQILEKIKQN